VLRAFFFKCQASAVSGPGDGAAVRVVSAEGTVGSEAGLLQVRGADGHYGSVCGLNAAAADLACRQLGFDFGVRTSAPCSSYGGRSVCGAEGSPVAVKNLKCTGAETDIAQCLWSSPDALCSDHRSDALVYCGVDARTPKEGGARLRSPDGAPSLEGAGMLEVVLGGGWSPVCGLSEGAAAVACKSMGFAGVASVPVLAKWNTVTPQLGNVQCGGSESDLAACRADRGDDVYCAPSEAVWLVCTGDGDASGRAFAW